MRKEPTYKFAIRCKAKYQSRLIEKLSHTDKFKPGSHELSQLYLNLERKIKAAGQDIIAMQNRISFIDHNLASSRAQLLGFQTKPHPLHAPSFQS